MELYSKKENYKLYQGSMLDMLEVIDKESIDAIVTDPPYELNFMGKGWDNAGVSFNKETWKNCFEVLKEGGYLLAFGGTRTYHRIACAIEDAGFEIRDCIMWLYGSGFPKSMDISKQIDKRPNRSYENLNLFGKKLKEQRELKGYSKNDIDKMIGTNTAYAWWEGRNYLGQFTIQLPDKNNYKKLKEILELNDDMDFIFEEAEREIIGKREKLESYQYKNNNVYQINGNKEKITLDITIPSTDLAKQWQGWGTCLKPAYEPIIVARKPFKGSLVDNIIEYGVGGLNIDECRVETTDKLSIHSTSKTTEENDMYKWSKERKTFTKPEQNLGRFPANVIHDGSDEVCEGFPNTNGGKRHNTTKRAEEGTSYYKDTNFVFQRNEFNDSGSASRYFYCAKASKKDRDEGLEEFEIKGAKELLNRKENSDGASWNGKYSSGNAYAGSGAPKKNIHPTVKPTELMQYLVRLVAPKGATILDPFNGSGSTGKAVMYENRERNKNYKYIGIELTEEYLPIAKARIDYVINLEDKGQEFEQITFMEE